jgi:hypothetical protein
MHKYPRRQKLVKVGMQKSSNKLFEVGIETGSDKKNGKGGHKLPLRLKLTKPLFDSPSDKIWQRLA